MDEFRRRLYEASSALILLSAEFERIEADQSDLLCEDYPFDKCLSEIVHDVLEWQESINKQMEEIKRGEAEDR